MNNLNKNEKLLIYLLSCALNDTAPNEKYFFDTAKLFRLSTIHSISPTIFFALRKNVAFKDFSEYEYFKTATDSNIKRRILFDFERSKILEDLKKQNIDFCILKGVILQDLYPSFEMRQMADNDILIRKDSVDEVRKIMKNFSYILSDTKVSNHDEFTKEPSLNFEFHSRLFRSTFSVIFDEYYKDVWHKLKKDEKNSYSMTLEDFYIYYVAHAYKHFIRGGIGIRTLADIYLFLQRYKKELDFSYIERELNFLKISSFSKMLIFFSMKLLKNPNKTFDILETLNDRQLKYLKFLLNSGTFGTLKNEISFKLKNKNKFQYILKRIFPDDAYFKEVSPFFYKHKFLRSFYLFKRLLSLYKNKENILKEINILKK